jgi:hypothetical protein
MAISRAEARLVTDEIKAAVTAILDAHDLTVGDIRSNYGDNYGFKVTATKVALGDDGFDYGTKEAQEWMLYGRSLDFEDPKSVLGKVVTMRGIEYTYMGYSGRSPKYPLRFKRTSDGKTYKFTETALRNLR